MIDVPGGIGHDLWVGANHAPRLLQTVNNVANFEVLAKFDSVLDAATQMQGLIFQQDDDTLLRIDFEVRADATPGIYLFAAALDGATAQEKRTALVAAGSYEGTLTLRVRRANTVSWQIAYRLGERNWVELSPFTHSIQINFYRHLSPATRGAILPLPRGLITSSMKLTRSVQTIPSFSVQTIPLSWSRPRMPGPSPARLTAARR